MSKKVLFVATVDYHFQKFHLPYLQWFKEQGWEVHVAAEGELELPFTDKKFNIPIQRSPFRLGNVAAYRELKSIIDRNNYNILHCHTPMGGVLARLAARQVMKEVTHVLYTAHGFHFCKGSSKLSWAVYYPVEKWLARYTDCLITINDEDYRLACSRRFPAGRIERVHGVGVNMGSYRPVDDVRKQELREHLGYGPDDFLMFYAAEFNKNKNQQLLIHAMAGLKSAAPNAKLLLAGDGPLLESCQKLAVKLGVEHMVRFLGYRHDIDELLPACDIAVASSAREGLPVNIAEAMACGLPVVALKNRGHSELVSDGVNGYIVEAPDPLLFSSRILMCYQSKELRDSMGTAAFLKVKKYSLGPVGAELTAIYSSYALEERDEMESAKWATR